MTTKLTHVKLGVSDIEISLKWYTDILGFEIDSCYPAENPVYYDFKQGGGACFSIGLAKTVVPNGRYNFQSENIDALWDQLKDKVTIIEPLFNTPWGTKKFTIADPDGNELGLN